MAERDGIPPTYFDLSPGSLSYGKLIIGGDAYADYIEAGNHPLDAPPLANALNSLDVIPIEERSQSPINWSEESLDSYVAAGRWLINAAQQASFGKRYKLGKKLIRQANSMGIFPSDEQIVHPARFKHKSGYYKKLGENNLWIQHPELQPLDARRYMIELSDEKGYFLEDNEFNQIAAVNSSAPSLRALEKRLGVGTTAMAREYGYWAERGYTTNDCINWGVAYALANSGELPTTSQMDDIFSKGRRGPSTTGVRSLFGTTKTFWASIELAVEVQKQLQAVMLERMKSDLATGVIPAELLAEVKQTNLSTSLYARYCVISQILPKMSDYSKNRIVVSELSDAQLIFELQRHDAQINADFLDQTAASLGMPTMSWRGKDYIASFGVDSVIKSILNKSRGELSPEEDHEMQDYISNGVDFLWTNPHLLKDRLFWNRAHISFLRKKRLMPSAKKTERLFGNTKLYGELISTVYRRQFREKMEREAGLRKQINSGIETKVLPQELFHTFNDTDESKDTQILSSEEKLIRYARYLVLKEMETSGFLPSLSISRRLSIASIGEDRSFNADVKSGANGMSVSAAEIETFASILGLSEYVYAERRKAHLERYKYQYKSRIHRSEARRRQALGLI